MCAEATSYFSDNDRDVLDLRHLIWDMNPSHTKGTAGTFLKAIDINSSPVRYYKLSAGDTISGIYGHEAANEVIVSRLLDLLGIPHLEYKGATSRIVLVDRERVEYVCYSDNFRKANDSKMALDTYYELYGKHFGSVEAMLREMGYSEYLDQMILVDFLIVNRDRHGANLEVLYSESDGIRLSPLFDHGFSLLAPLQNHVEMVEIFDAMRDVEANNFIGSRSLFANLDLIKKPVKVIKLKEKDLLGLFSSLGGVLSDAHMRKIVEILVKRYNYVKDKKILCEVE